jgi:hypothetical protein
MVYIFAFQKSQFWYILEGLGLDNLGMLILWHLVNFFMFWYVVKRKNGQRIKE